ncbi:MAG: Gfo/Idh/MocA family oxidoreductase [Bryobacterales bacterium]|nr:Gfo/Idh/MocA family oxidoreductase [Bryobacterales bacterium]
MTRRAALGAAAVLPSRRFAGRAANDAVTVGLLGSGNRGSYVAQLLAKNTPARVTALCDVVEDHMAKAAKQIGVEGAAFHKDYRRLLESDVDAVIIATPVYLHAEHFEAAARAGKHIYIEKPASVDVEGCKRIIRAADSADRKLNITFGFQRRYAQLYRKAKQVADSGAIGAIHLAAARFIKSEGAASEAARLGPPVSDKDKLERWHAWKEFSGDLIVENNVHSIDVLNWFLNAHPASAIGAGGVRRPSRGDMRDHNFIAYTYPDGTQGQLSGATIASPGYRDVVEQFFGEKAMIETSENHFRYVRSRSNETIEKTPRNMTIDAVEEFVKRIAEKRPENTAIRGAESTLTAILGRLAMDARREVTWDEMMKG